MCNTRQCVESPVEEPQAIRKPSRRQLITCFADVVFSPALVLRNMIQRNGSSSRPLTYIILLNRLSQEIKPPMCASRERFLFCFVFLFPKDVLKVAIKLVVER